MANLFKDFTAFSFGVLVGTVYGSAVGTITAYLMLLAVI